MDFMGWIFMKLINGKWHNTQTSNAKFQYLWNIIILVISNRILSYV
jgi:glycerol kinase